MKIECVVLGKKGDRESDDEAPMDDPDQRIPHVYFALMSAAHSILLLVVSAEPVDWLIP
jgi:hypothetical protein